LPADEEYAAEEASRRRFEARVKARKGKDNVLRKTEQVSCKSECRQGPFEGNRKDGRENCTEAKEAKVYHWSLIGRTLLESVSFCRRVLTCDDSTTR
jgi:hypothetical protein